MTLTLFCSYRLIHIPLSQLAYTQNQRWINEVFQGSSVEEIVERLEDIIAGKRAAHHTMDSVSDDTEASGRQWAQDTLGSIRMASPTALKVQYLKFLSLFCSVLASI